MIAQRGRCAGRNQDKVLKWLEVKAMVEHKMAYEERKVAIEEKRLRNLGEKVFAKNMQQEYKIHVRGQHRAE